MLFCVYKKHTETETLLYNKSLSTHRRGLPQGGRARARRVGGYFTAATRRDAGEGGEEELVVRALPAASDALISER